ncbi:MAG: polysaccharide lyase family 7 protein [Actinomycetota bacterium]|nr:polysaccharide lyase family 7 protein [Actinomycetota bacterium]
MPADWPLGGTGCQPNQILDLSFWELTLPTGSGGSRSGSPLEILPLNLGGLLNVPWFRSTPDCAAVAFRAPVTGTTTKGSHYPRSELRELAAGGERASWSSTSGTHWMEVTEAFTALPSGKPELVGAQIHGSSDDITVFRLEGSNLYVTDGNNPHYKLVTSQYRLGTPFTATFLVSQGVVHAFYNGQLQATIHKSFSGAYFKAGAYTQANCSNSPCNQDNYGETMIYDLRVSHTRDAPSGLPGT